MTQIELFEQCTGIKLPWHIKNNMISVLTNRGKFFLKFPNHVELRYNKETVSTYIQSPVFEELVSSNGSLYFVYGCLEEYRDIFKCWKIEEEKNKE